MRALFLVPLLLACSESTVEEEPVHGLLRLASITGTVQLGTTPTGDGMGPMLVILSIASNEHEIMPHRIFVEPLVDIGAEGAAVPFQLTNIFPQDEPYHLGAFVDDDGGMAQGSQLTTTPGDLASWGKGEYFEEIVLGSGEEREMVILLDHVVE